MSKIFVKVKTGAKDRSVKKIDENTYKVSVKEPPIEGRANYAVVKLLAEYLDKSISQLRIISGSTSKNKVIEVL